MYRFLSRTNIEKVNHFALLLFAFSINFPQKIVIYTLAFWLLTCLPILKFRKVSVLKNVPNIPLLILALLFFGRILIAIYHSDLSVFVLKQLLDTQLPLFVLPIILIFTANKLLELNKVLIMYIVGCFVSAVISVIYFYLFRFGILDPYAHLLFVPLRDMNSTFSDDVILFQGYISDFFKHRAAVGANLVMATGCLIYLVKQQVIGLKSWHLVAVCFVGVFFVCVIYATGSRSGLISLFSVLVISVTYLLFNKRKKLVLGFLLIAALLSGCMYLKTTRSLMISEISSLDYNKIRTADARFEIWESALEIIKANPFAGVGYSQVDDLLIEKYKTKGLLLFAKERLKTHNQFLQFSLESGVWAAVFYVLFLLPIYFGKKNRYLSFSFSAVFFFYSMFEDSLILINGVSLLTFFIVILYLLNKEETIIAGE